MSSGTNSERITQNNTKISTNNTAIDNFKTAIQNLPSRSPEANDFAELIDEYNQQFRNTVEKLLNKKYTPYLNEPKTIYSPGNDYKYFIINKKAASNEYRIIWYNKKCMSWIGTAGLYIGESIYFSYQGNIDDESVINSLNIRPSNYRNIKFSTSYSTVQALLEAISTPNISYNSPSSEEFNNDKNFNLITNIPVLDADSSFIENCYSLSDDLTILPLE